MNPLSFYDDIRIYGELIYMEHLKMQSPNIVSDNMAYIAQRWPECLTEAKDENGKLRQVIDFDKLRQALSSDATGEGQERYQFTWPDKRHAIRMANTPITSTLRPVVDDETTPTGKDSKGNKYCSSGGVDFDNTQNLYVEGDNLEVLKLLRESYLGKVKMIYIDPPYNTGGDFVYRDNFIKKNSDYTEVSGAYDEEGNQIASEFEKNADTNGRFHTDWLNMIYPRLKVARDLLTDDGVIFISIGVEELANLKFICNEIFGESNFIEVFSWVKTSTPPSLAIKSRKTNEYILCYEKNKSNIKYNGELLDGGDQPLLNSGNTVTELIFNHSKVYFKEEIFPDGIYEPYDADKVSLLDKIEIKNGYATADFRLRGEFKWTRDFMNAEVNKGTTFIIKSRNLSIRFIRVGKGYKRPTNFIKEKYITPVIDKPNNGVGTNESASSYLCRIMGDMPVFSYPKPYTLIQYLINFICKERDIILDFFSGSATTAHAVMQLNAEDGGNRKYIMVQLPEVTDEKSEAYKAGYKNICEIGKERIRRAGKKIKEEHPDWKGDTGFRVLKVDSSNMEDVFYTPAATDMQNLFADNIKADRTDEDLLLQVMMELGIALSEKIEKTEIAGKTVWNVKQGYLMACFEPNVSEDTITAIAKQQPQYFVMADRSLASDNVADNFEQLFEEYSPTTIRKIL